MSEIIDLRPWGYAPGNYAFKCVDCPTPANVTDYAIGDKRAWRCRKHAIEFRDRQPEVMTTVVTTPSQVALPIEPTEAMWDGLARQIMMWLDMHPKTPRALFKHLKSSGYTVPKWLTDEPEMKNLDHVPSKGTRCVIIYKAMMQAHLESIKP